MNVKTLEGMLRIDAFRPFRLVMNNGRKIEIKHPEFVMLTNQGDLFVFRPSQHSETLPESIETIVAVKNISEVEPLVQQAA